MFQRKSRRFRRRSNGRGHLSHGNGHGQTRLRSSPYSNSHKRNNHRVMLSPEQLLEKYNTLAKEAMSSGDETLCENYLQHADHFARIIEDKNKYQNKDNIINKTTVADKHPSENSEAASEGTTKNKE